jgi:mono/diheme cytochrome c family protein
MRQIIVVLLSALIPGLAFGQTRGTLKTDADVERLFAGTCGWCHSDGGRQKGKGPQLMGTQLSDSEIAVRIKVGKPGSMPSFAAAFTEEDVQAIVHYIRSLKPRK